MDTGVVRDEEDELRQGDVAEADLKRDQRILCPDHLR